MTAKDHKTVTTLLISISTLVCIYHLFFCITRHWSIVSNGTETDDSKFILRKELPEPGEEIGGQIRDWPRWQNNTG